MPKTRGGVRSKLAVEKTKKRALLKLAYPRGSELYAGAGFFSPARVRAHPEKTVKQNSPLCGPVRGFGKGVGKSTSETPDRPCWSRVSQLWTSRANPRKAKPSPSPVGGGVEEAAGARQRRKKLGRKPAQDLPSDHNISPKTKQWREV